MVNVQLADLHPAGVVRRQGVDGRRHLPAWSAPFRPKVHQDRHIRLQNIRIEACIIKFNGIGARHVIPPSRLLMLKHSYWIQPVIRRYNSLYSAAEAFQEKSACMAFRISFCHCGKSL
jgi:hypothetical protein